MRRMVLNLIEQSTYVATEIVNSLRLACLTSVVICVFFLIYFYAKIGEWSSTENEGKDSGDCWLPCFFSCSAGDYCLLVAKSFELEVCTFCSISITLSLYIRHVLSSALKLKGMLFLMSFGHIFSNLLATLMQSIWWQKCWIMVCSVEITHGCTKLDHFKHYFNCVFCRA